MERVSQLILGATQVFSEQTAPGRMFSLSEASASVRALVDLYGYQPGFRIVPTLLIRDHGWREFFGMIYKPIDGTDPESYWASLQPVGAVFTPSGAADAVRGAAGLQKGCKCFGAQSVAVRLVVIHGWQRRGRSLVKVSDSLDTI